MPDVTQDFPIAVPPERVFAAISTPDGLSRWWTKRAAGEAKAGSTWELGFGPGYDWRARVTRCDPDASFELQIVSADADWQGTRVGFELTPTATGTQVHFHHLGWPQGNEHYRISCFCWAMYLRVMKRNLEHGETVPYELRLEV